MKTTLLIAAIAAGFTFAATAEAREGRGGPMDMPAFEDLDANGDGTVTLEEIETAMQAMSDARFAAADTNGDGALSADEMTARADAARAERLQQRITEQLERLDSNEDGVLQADELAAARENRPAGGAMAERMFDRADENDDGALSAEEYQTAQTRLHARFDHHHGDHRRGDH